MTSLNTRQLPTVAVDGLLDAIVRRLTVPDGLDSTGRLLALDGAGADVRLAIAAIQSRHLELDTVLRFALLLIDRSADAPAPLPPGHGPNHIDNAGHAVLACGGVCAPGSCITCGHADSAGVWHPAAVTA